MQGENTVKPAVLGRMLLLVEPNIKIDYLVDLGLTSESCVEYLLEEGYKYGNCETPGNHTHPGRQYCDKFCPREDVASGRAKSVGPDTLLRNFYRDHSPKNICCILYPLYNRGRRHTEREYLDLDRASDRLITVPKQ